MTIRVHPLIRILYKSAPLKVGLIVFSCVLLLTAWGMKENLKVDHWASWVQAIGSITALGVAIFVMSRQNKHAAKLIADADRLSTLRRAQSVDAIIKRSYKQINNVKAGTAASATNATTLAALKIDLEVSKEILVAMRKSISDIPAYDLGSFDMADAAHQFIESIGEYIVVIDHLVAAPDLCGRDGTKHTVDLIHRVVDDAVMKFDRGMSSLKQ